MGIHVGDFVFFRCTHILIRRVEGLRLGQALKLEVAVRFRDNRGRSLLLNGLRLGLLRQDKAFRLGGCRGRIEGVRCGDAGRAAEIEAVACGEAVSRGKAAAVLVAEVKVLGCVCARCEEAEAHHDDQEH